MIRRTNIAVIGAADWGENLVRDFHALGVLKSVSYNEPEVLDGIYQAYPDVKVVTDYEAVWSDSEIKGVAIATPGVTHGYLVRCALEAGKDVYVEKPLNL